MTAVLLIVHVIAGILFVGPVTVAASVFPRYARSRNVGAVDLLHRISLVYAVLSLAVPVFGVATALRMGVLGQAWVMVSSALTVVAAPVLAVAVLPAQRRVVAALHAADGAPDTTVPIPIQLGMYSGFFALIWVAVVALMIIRPGSTTGVGL
jgi:hypothetical protein